MSMVRRRSHQICQCGHPRSRVDSLALLPGGAPQVRARSRVLGRSLSYHSSSVGLWAHYRKPLPGAETTTDGRSFIFTHHSLTVSRPVSYFGKPPFLVFVLFFLSLCFFWAPRNMCRPLYGGTCSIRITAGRIISLCSICRHISCCVWGGGGMSPASLRASGLVRRRHQSSNRYINSH